MNNSILHICQNYNTKLFENLVNELYKESKKNQIVIYPSFEKKFKLFKSKNITILRFKSINKYLRHLFILRGLFNFYKSKKHINIDDIDIIHCHTLFNDGIVGLIYSLLYNKKLVLSIRQSDLHIFKKKIWLIPYLFFLKISNARFIALSQELKNNFWFFNPTVIGNGIDESFIKKDINFEVDSIKKRNILYIGRIIKRKNVDKIIHINKNYNLTIVGNSYPLTKYGIKTIEKIKYNKTINYIEKLDKDEIKNIIDKSDIFILPSIKETFGIVYLESIARGKPIIYSKNTGVDGFFEHNVGIGLKDFKRSTINKAINDIINSYFTYSYNCIKEIKNHTWQKVAQRILKIYYD